jgi:hypothetical protein
MRFHRSTKRFVLSGAALITATMTWACVDEEIVYRDRELFETPATQAMGMLGYTDSETKLTVCGNCHVGHQADWKETAHADAWEGLQTSSHASATCEGCHTVNELGNFVDQPAGHTAVPDARYYDVQCESCHGPGLTHVTNPEESQPLASIAVGADLTNGCGECHADAHHPFVEEWEQSAHGFGGTAPESYRTREGCDYCHGGKAALATFGINSEYVEKFDDSAPPIVCAVCHDPHGDARDANGAVLAGQLRFPIDVLDEETNLCMKCHHKRAVPDQPESRGAHSPQGPLLIGRVGEVGWTPPNFIYNEGSIRGTHGSEANPRLCAGCHVNAYDVTDATGGFVISATGHLFKAIPCVDSQGIPQASDDCAKTVEARDFSSCTASGCHGDETSALTALNIAQTRIADLVEELEGLLELVEDAYPDANVNNDGIFTTYEGAEFNASLGEIESSAVHNPFMTEALLTASIKQVLVDYPAISAQITVNLNNLLGMQGSR